MVTWLSVMVTLIFIIPFIKIAFLVFINENGKARVVCIVSVLFHAMNEMKISLMIYLQCKKHNKILFKFIFRMRSLIFESEF